MAYEEIFTWVRDNWNKLKIDPTENSEEIFETINKRFDDDNRSDLSDILGDEKPKFLEFIEDETKQSPEDFEISELDFRFAQLEQELRDLTGFNILGTPIR